MESTLYIFMLSAALTHFAFSQDTLLQDTNISQKSSPKLLAFSTGSQVATVAGVSANLSRLEEHLGNRIRDAERRIEHRFDRRFRVLNQTATIAHLEDIVDFYTAEMDEQRLKNRGQDDAIKHLKTHNVHQQRELRRLRTSLEHLTKHVTSLSQQLQQQQRAGARADAAGSTTVTGSSENEVGGPTTSVPFKPLFPTDCQYVYKTGGMKYPGDYYIMIQPVLSDKPFKVCCKMTNNSGWTLVQRRQDGSVDFYRDWQGYRDGFGNLEGDFWLGNEHIYQLTNQGDYKLRIEMRDWENNDYWAEYEHFRIENEAEKYRLHLHGYQGDAGDAMTSRWESHSGQAFSTHDSDHDERFYDNCAEHYRGGWWFKSCFQAHLNGVYYHKGAHNNYFVRDGIQWNTIHPHSSLQTVSMMVKPNPDYRETDEAANGI